MNNVSENNPQQDWSVNRAVRSGWDNIVMAGWGALGFGLLWIIGWLTSLIRFPDVSKFTPGQWFAEIASLLFGVCVGGFVFAFWFKHKQTALDESLNDALNVRDPGSAVGKLFGRASVQLDNGEKVLGGFAATVANGNDVVTSAGKILNRFEEWGGIWSQRVDRLVQEAEKHHLKDLWLTRPWEYVTYISEVDERYAASQEGHHLPELVLYGTMVGFAFLLPEAIRNHVCRAEGQFRKLRLIASDAQPTVDGKMVSLVRFPLYLIASIVQELLGTCERFTAALASGKSLDIEVCYLPHDLLTGAISFPRVETVVLQAFDTKTFNQILEEQEFQRGFRYYNNPEATDACDRYDSVLQNMAEEFRVGAGAGNATLAKCEVWKLTARNGIPVLTISDPHWEWDSEGDQVSSILTRHQYLQAPSKNPESFSGVDNISRVAATMLRFIERSEPDIGDLLEKVATKKVLWAERHNMQCPCKVLVHG